MGVGYLVTGNPGAGKSTVAAELVRRGHVAIDPDYDPELSYWEDERGVRVLLAEGPPNPDLAWLRAHRWVWSRQRIEERIAEQDGSVFICGIALNIDQLVGVFHRVVLLRIDAATQEQRLVAHDAANPPGRSDAGRQQIREGLAVFETNMLELGALPVDGTRAPPIVTDDVIRAVGLT